ncbi:hypothetical protein KOR34_46410 [Posidoniimonas corsicana]|uniref:Uncharacterized protein n=1 Tax=Posidoniimonas corsicana TaxID=1938618 RepID=A0A5C5V0L2_9BACT|nr:hypothetical protein [Posidoniimonas corsicana]TWT31265.1 hypothetical protein KOR34_46410 [Posidoniimonas corsicana]
MARDYAGYLGCLGMIVALLRGAVHGAGIDGTILQGVASLAAFAAVGAVIGAIAETVVDESVKTQLEKQLAEADPAEAA